MSDDEGYVHDPEAFDEQGEPVVDSEDMEAAADSEAAAATEKEGTASDPGSADDESLTGVHPTAVDREFGWRGWVLVGVILVAFVIAPAAVYFYPPDASGYLFALIIFPLLPAVVLGLAAVWATTRP